MLINLKIRVRILVMTAEYLPDPRQKEIPTSFRRALTDFFQYYVDENRLSEAQLKELLEDSYTPGRVVEAMRMRQRSEHQNQLTTFELELATVIQWSINKRLIKTPDDALISMRYAQFRIQSGNATLQYAKPQEVGVVYL